MLDMASKFDNFTNIEIYFHRDRLYLITLPAEAPLHIISCVLFLILVRDLIFIDPEWLQHRRQISNIFTELHLIYI